MVDIAFIGHYTQDTIVSAAGTRLVDGGAFNYGAHVAVRMGLRVAAITRLAREALGVVQELEQLGVVVRVQVDPRSTCLRLVYPTANVDERTIYVTGTAQPFTPQDVDGVPARAYVVGASMRGEVPLAVMEALAQKDARVAADVQGFLRVLQDGVLVPALWPERDAVLACVDILKADAVEAKLLTGESDIHRAAQALADLGPREIVLTHRDGVLVQADDQIHEAGFFPAELVGRSGRGDTCLAAYTARRLTHSPAEATLWAAAVASLKMEAEGPFRRDIGAVHDLIRRRYGGQGA
jgi:sugar/nucleoside kinase (ribokinase family)